MKKPELGRRVSIPTKVFLEAHRRFGIGLEDLGSMIRKAAVITHPKGNKRFHDYGFLVEDGALVDVFLLSDPAAPKSEAKKSLPTFYKCEVCKDSKKEVVFSECDYCEGAGCEMCSHTGMLEGEIPCQNCK